MQDKRSNQSQPNTRAHNKQILMISAMAVTTLAVILGFIFGPQAWDSYEASQRNYPQLSTKVAKDESEVKIKTTVGDITIKLFPKEAPLAVENFIQHAKDNYYNDTTFHRVIKNFMIQGGDPKGDGTGGQSIWKGKDTTKDSGNGFANEISKSLYNIRGALSMANSGADTNGSQFFIVQNKDDQSGAIQKAGLSYPGKILDAYKKGGVPSLDGNYTVFGQVIDGMDIVDKIATAEVKKSANGEDSSPLNPVKITGIEVIKEAK